MTFSEIYTHYGREIPWGFYKFDTDVFDMFLRYRSLFWENWLDVWCGYSPWLGYIQENNIQYIGLDIVESVLFQNQIRFPNKNIQFILGDIRDIDFQKNTFSCIIDLWCLHCIPSNFHKDILAKYAQYTQPGGYIFIRFFQSDDQVTPLFYIDGVPIWWINRSQLLDSLREMFLLVEEYVDSNQFDITNRISLILKKV